MKHRVAEELNFVLVFVGAIWLAFIANAILPGDFNHWGLAPRHISGLVGIVTMPFLHGGWAHLLGNTVPLVVLLCLLAGSRANSVGIVAAIILLGGALLWLFGGSKTIHVGASGLVYGLITFLIVAGFREARFVAIVIAIFVGVTYGATLFSGVLPFMVGKNVSWDGHLFGAIAGGLVAVAAVKPKRESVLA